METLIGGRMMVDTSNVRPTSVIQSDTRNLSQLVQEYAIGLSANYLTEGKESKQAPLYASLSASLIAVMHFTFIRIK
jgi:hypothetical protein